MKPIALFTATRWEFRAVCRALNEVSVGRLHGRRRAWGRRGDVLAHVLQTGIGKNAASSAAEQLLSTEVFSAVLSVGFGGALVAGHVGDLLIATDVLEIGQGSDRASSRWACSPMLHQTAASAAAQVSLPARSGALATVPTIVVSARCKAELSAATGAIGLDMESSSVGATAAEHAVPFLAVRVISDRADEDLPPSFNDFLVPGGWMRGMVTLLVSPSHWAALNRLRRQSQVAGERLSAFVAAFLDAQR